jgi:hypothetical protein
LAFFNSSFKDVYFSLRTNGINSVAFAGYFAINDTRKSRQKLKTSARRFFSFNDLSMRKRWQS